MRRARERGRIRARGVRRHRHADACGDKRLSGANLIADPTTGEEAQTLNRHVWHCVFAQGRPINVHTTPKLMRLMRESYKSEGPLTSVSWKKEEALGSWSRLPMSGSMTEEGVAVGVGVGGGADVAADVALPVADVALAGRGVEAGRGEEEGEGEGEGFGRHVGLGDSG